MKRLIKKALQKAKEMIVEMAVPVMSFLIVVLALTPYLREQRGYYAIGGEYILAGVVAYAVHRAQCTVRSEK
jgi:hypothetical protein